MTMREESERASERERERERREREGREKDDVVCGHSLVLEKDVVVRVCET